MEVVDTHFEGMKPLFDVVLIDIVELTAQPEPREGRQMAVTIGKKHSRGEIVFLGQFMQERSGWISASSSEHCDIEN
ncbi:hypothetical protein Htur_4656 (plasmid) [Haloterrigena turkmenica DSM 5511]|uniref:Uncharacterized protein n=1 Tax=Haloterrigena turkmenica (strain ATCC 51198 / DSM 5511 / JCM 9101 / NCIMB 13204 / VKM B-1734 / 4k) TaxID=543526 RepID=D2S244_HALTV|nr:hypothetical protein Htur_4656 [Haloterrigena turkmenica DSM 5511]